MFKKLWKKIKRTVKKIKKSIMRLFPFNLFNRKDDDKKKSSKNTSKSYDYDDVDTDDEFVSIFDSVDNDDSEDIDYEDAEEYDLDENEVYDEDAEFDGEFDDSAYTNDDDVTIDSLDEEEVTDRLIALAKTEKGKAYLNRNDKEESKKNIKKITGTKQTKQEKLTAKEHLSIGDSGPIKEAEVHKNEKPFALGNNKAPYDYPIMKLDRATISDIYTAARTDRHSPVNVKDSYTEMDIKMFIEYNKSLYLKPEMAKDVNITADKIYVDELGPIPYFPMRSADDSVEYFQKMIVHPGTTLDFVSTAIRIDRINEAKMLHDLYPDKYDMPLTISEVGTRAFNFKPIGKNDSYETIYRKWAKLKR